MNRFFFFLALLALLTSCHRQSPIVIIYPEDSVAIPAPDYVGLAGDHFVINGEPWFPLMLNYKAFIKPVGDSLEVVPAPYYQGDDISQHFDTIAAWGFNAIRLCLDVLDYDMDSTAMFQATRRVIQQADSAGLRVMLLIKTPFDPYWQSYTKGLLRTLADLPALWAYDFMNEPLYFDPEPKREKQDAVGVACEWLHWVRTYAPHQLFTIATAEPIEVFEWDPSILPIDFIEMHTYHPLRVQSEMWWYSHYCHKPWIVGETGLPADNDSVPYEWQREFMLAAYEYAMKNNAAGFGWWEFQDYPEGVNFEAQYTGLCDTSGIRKPAAGMVSLLDDIITSSPSIYRDEPPVNYYNMLGYRNVCLTGQIIDKKTKKPVEGALVRGWNDNWSVGMNTYTDSNGRFTLYSNDYNVHFEVSAPGMSHLKFNRKNIKYSKVGNIDENNLPNRSLEYQQIDYRNFIPVDNNGNRHFCLDFNSKCFNLYSLSGDMGTIKLEYLK